MIVLGISPLDKDATVTLMQDGEIVCAVAEERLSRKKMHAGFPHQALAMVLKMAGVTADDIDHVMYAFYDWPQEVELMRKNQHSDYQFNRGAPKKTHQLLREAARRVPMRELKIPGLSDPDEMMIKPWYKKFCYRLFSSDSIIGDLINQRQFKTWLRNSEQNHREWNQELKEGLKKFGLESKLERVEHHQAHVGNAFYCSGFDEALVVTVDAYGSGLSSTISVVDGNGIRRLDQIETPTSMGEYYSSVTSALGYNPDRHAGKIVGLAAYGDPEVLGDTLRSWFVWENSSYRMRRSSDVFLGRHLATHFPKIDVAAAYQTILEEVVTRHVRHFVKQTGLSKVVMSGGVVANVKLNQRIHEIEGVRDIYIHPGMGDGGLGTGAAVLKYVEAGIPTPAMESAYLGPDYDDQTIETALREAGLTFEQFDEIEPEIARLIADNHVVARFNGRMEYGPRALGNRSILYPAQDPGVNQWLNERLGRTEFMPFAPATLYEDREQCYQNVEGAEFTAQFMTITFDCTPWMIENCPAAVHVDGTARPQLVTEESNPSFYRIINEYKKITGNPSIINTSFNMHEEPIVCTPQDAIRAFQLGRLDYLAMGNYLVGSAAREQRGASGNTAVETARGL